MNLSRLPLLLAALFLIVPSAAQAETFHPDAKIFIHLTPDTEERRLNCYTHGVESAATDAKVTGEVSDKNGYYAYILVSGVNTEVGITGVQFGIAYDPEENSGVDIDYWQDCALMEWHEDDWPQAGAGNLLTWNQENGCQKDEVIVVGFFHLYAHSPDQFRIIPRPVDDKALVAACGLTPQNYKDYVSVFKPENMGRVGFGGKDGYNPADPKQNLLDIKKSFKRLKGSDN